MHPVLQLCTVLLLVSFCCGAPAPQRTYSNTFLINSDYTYNLRWNYSPSRVQFSQSADGVQGWIGFGIARTATSAMARSDLFISFAFTSNGTTNWDVLDLNATGQVQPARDQIYNIDDKLFSQDSSGYTFEWSRALVTNDSAEDRPFAPCIHLIWAFKTTSGSNMYHDNRGIIPDFKLCPTCAAPNVPRNVRNSAGGAAGALLLAWDEPDNLMGSPVTYEIKSQAGATLWTGSERSATVTTSEKNVQVFAKTCLGTSPAGLAGASSDAVQLAWSASAGGVFAVIFLCVVLA